MDEQRMYAERGPQSGAGCGDVGMSGDDVGSYASKLII